MTVAILTKYEIRCDDVDESRTFPGKCQAHVEVYASSVGEASAIAESRYGYLVQGSDAVWCPRHRKGRGM